MIGEITRKLDLFYRYFLNVKYSIWGARNIEHFRQTVKLIAVILSVQARAKYSNTLIVQIT